MIIALCVCFTPNISPDPHPKPLLETSGPPLTRPTHYVLFEAGVIACVFMPLTTSQNGYPTTGFDYNFICCPGFFFFLLSFYPHLLEYLYQSQQDYHHHHYHDISVNVIKIREVVEKNQQSEFLSFNLMEKSTTTKSLIFKMSAVKAEKCHKKKNTTYF